MYFDLMSPKAEGKPSRELLNLIERYFGSFDEFKTQFTNEAVKHFGSG